MAALWPGAKVVDAALPVSIQEIRKALVGMMEREAKGSPFVI